MGGNWDGVTECIELMEKTVVTQLEECYHHHFCWSNNHAGGSSIFIDDSGGNDSHEVSFGFILPWFCEEDIKLSCLLSACLRTYYKKT